MSADDRLDALLSEHAGSYREPGATPRDDMWEHIREARRAQRVTPLRPRRRWLQSIAAAAALLILGIAIGRYTAETPSGDRPMEHVDAGSADAHGGSTANPYRLAASEHFGRVEVLLTQFGNDGEGDDDVLEWSRSLLADTQLLLNSPAGREPQYRELLVDLELVLTQIVRAAGRHSEDERRWVAEGLEQRGVLQRLRTLTPANAGT